MAGRYTKNRRKHPRQTKPSDKSVAAGPSTGGTEGWRRCVLTAEFLSDAHLGTGSGGGGIDALVARDRNDRPVIWASHIEGVLRDAARRLLGEPAAGNFFGRAGGERQRATFTSLYTSNSPKTHIWRSTARADFFNRAPKEHTLRVIEFVPKGTRFVGEVELRASDVPTLERLVREVDALGSGRASGAGRVKLSLAAPQPRGPVNCGVAKGRLVVLLRNLDPLCITATATPDNLIPSLAFVPGRSLLGALAAWLISEGDRNAASLLTSGNVSVSDALPLPREPATLDEAEVLPAPLSLQRTKPGSVGDELPWWAQPTAATVRIDAWARDEKLKRPEDDLFVYRQNPSSAWTTFRPGRRVRLRNGRPDPRKAKASLFAIEQIVEGTHFLAELRGLPADIKRLADALRPVLQGLRWLRMGRAGAPVEVARFTWLDNPRPAQAGTVGRLTLTSDLLVRDGELRWRTVLDETALKELLGIELTLGRSAQDSVMVHGFNGTSRLWRMPAAAIRRGSVFEVSGAGVERLAARAACGDWLGERSHEGFGRFRFDTALPGVTNETSAFTPDARSAETLEESVARKTREWFEQCPSLAGPGGGSARKPSLSQWQDLVGELEAKAPRALTSRLEPVTKAGSSWAHREARHILEKLNETTLPATERALYARFFVRWLRASMPKNTKGSP